MSVLDELVVLPSAPGMRRMSGIDPFECLDAASEDANGRLPHETGYIDPYHTRSNAMAVENALLQGRREKILEYLDTNGQANTRQLEELCEVSRGALAHLLRDLERENQIAVVVPGSRSGPAVYALVDEDQEAEQDDEEAAQDDDEQEAEGVSIADVEELQRAADDEFDTARAASLRGRYIDFLVRAHPTRLLYLVLEGKIEPTEDVLEAIEKVVF